MSLWFLKYHFIVLVIEAKITLKRDFHIIGLASSKTPKLPKLSLSNLDQNVAHPKFGQFKLKTCF